MFKSTKRRKKRVCNVCGAEKTTASTAHYVRKNGLRVYCGFLRVIREED